MSRKQQFGKSTPVVASAALALTLLGLAAISPVRALPSTAHRFISYMNAIDKSGQPMTLADKITYSLVLSGPNPKQVRRAGSASGRT
ncbi:hypothetical protein [uncultured Paludibaculum sp.]|uniref:hypothetical protein n=1 Tax=uncultured Paludibaculum sp. TaxID=1765020 RepID=UPI002AAC2CE3|nr:hypothetical protein [uncultured Paludibaculum sp.]